MNVFSVNTIQYGVSHTLGTSYLSQEFSSTVIPTKITWEALGPVDDDVRLRIGSIELSNPKLNPVWYFGENQLYEPGGNWANINLNWATEGFRKIVLDRYMLPSAKREALVWGSHISVDTFDGWGDGYNHCNWTSTISFSVKSSVLTIEYFLKMPSPTTWYVSNVLSANGKPMLIGLDTYFNNIRCIYFNGTNWRYASLSGITGTDYFNLTFSSRNDIAIIGPKLSAAVSNILIKQSYTAPSLTTISSSSISPIYRVYDEAPLLNDYYPNGSFLLGHPSLSLSDF